MPALASSKRRYQNALTGGSSGIGRPRTESKYGGDVEDKMLSSSERLLVDEDEDDDAMV